MTFESFSEAQSFFLWATFGIALLMGAIVNKTNFCTMGAVSDMVNMGDLGRFRAWLLAIAVAITGVVVLEYIGLAQPYNAFPPYRAGQLIWAENLLGGLMFGVGMTLASGCGNKCLVRIGGGNLKSVMVMLVIAVIAYYMIYPFPGSDQTLFTLLFYDWIRPLAVNLGASQDLGALLSNESPGIARLIIGGGLSLLLLVYAFKSAEFRGSFDNILGGLAVGLAVLAAWYVTSNVQIDADGELYSLSGYYTEWEMLADSPEGKPAESRQLSPQSFTFINPMGQALGYTAGGFDRKLLTFGVMAFLGVIAGSLLWSLLKPQLPLRVVQLLQRLRHAFRGRGTDGLRRRAGHGLHHRPGHHRHLCAGRRFLHHLHRHRAGQRPDHEGAVLQAGLRGRGQLRKGPGRRARRPAPAAQRPAPAGQGLAAGPKMAARTCHFGSGQYDSTVPPGTADFPSWVVSSVGRAPDF